MPGGRRRSARAEGGRRRAPVGGIGGAGELARERGGLRRRLRVAAGGELDEGPHAHLGIRVLRRLAERVRGRRREPPGSRSRREANVACVVGR